MILGVHPLLQSLAPELVLVVGAALVMLIGLSKRRKVADSAFSIALSTMAIAAYAAYRLQQSPPPGDATLLGDSLVSFTRLCVLGVGFLILLVLRHVPEQEERGEFFGLTLCAFAGIVMVAAANDLVLLFLSLELVSVPTYILIGLSRRDIRAQEATGKYFFLGAFAAALTLYGFSFLYGAAGTTQLFGAAGSPHSIAGTIRVDLDSPLVVIGLLLSIGGLAFKIAAVPMHFYIADVYQGAASPVTGLLGFVPKLAGFIALIRLLSVSGWDYPDALFWLLWVMAALTMIVGNTLALWQQNVKRMLAYSSVAHTGYMLVGITAGPALANAGRSPLRDGPTAALFYMVIYGVMNLGAFAVLSFFRKSGPDGEDSVETLDELAGAARRHRWASLALAICVLGLMGFPLTGGFFGKFYLLTSALSVSTGNFRQNAMVVLVVIAVLNSAIAAAYYLRIVASCYLRKPAEGVRASPCRALQISIAACALVVLAVFLRPSILFDRARDAMDR
ncbi:MAG: NADH-quinone oxidoreductase subunit N, partial [Planctomycetota bacterium]|nr:NADH-quinone oxidoreductase subunit N [Planctomycetota bacterium]